MQKLLTLIAQVLAFHHVLSVPSSDPFADSTADGGTSYAAGSNLVGKTTARCDETHI